jgi:pimeloyl-ACP methyl ester carboxylesterase
VPEVTVRDYDRSESVMANHDCHRDARQIHPLPPSCYLESVNQPEETMTTTLTQNTTQPARSRKRGCLLLVRRGLLALVAGIAVFASVGSIYQALATDAARRAYPPPGQLFEVDGHKMHLRCIGAGSPTVILEAGGFSFSDEWYWVQPELAKTNRTCAYDRAGMGWSTPGPDPRDPLRLVGELHALLEKVGVPGPYVLVGHSFGAILNRVYASQYPGEVQGIVLVDTGFVLPKTFKDQAEFDSWKSSNEILQTALRALVYTGLGHMVIGSEIGAMGYPPDVAERLTAFRASNQSYDTYYAELMPVRRQLGEASVKAEHLGVLPLLALWADWSNTFQGEDKARFAAIQSEVLTYSTNSAARVVTGSDHGSILGNPQYATQVVQGVRDVIQAAQSGTPLAQSGASS